MELPCSRVEYPGMTDSKDWDAPRRRLAALVRESGTESLKSLSLALGRSTTYLQDYLDGSPRQLKYEDRQTLARRLGCHPDELAVVRQSGNHADNVIDLPPKANLTFDYRVRPPAIRDLPIRGHARAGKMGLFIDQGNHWGFAMRPESLRDVPDAYAVRVVDDSMKPRFVAGNVLAIDPHRRPQPGDNVVIQLRDEQAFIKELVRRTEKAVICKQYNPEETVEYKESKILAVHMVVGIDFLER